ncbi:hypothetical protein [Bacteroides fragilis]|uniref:Uncharacterized protein n=1 Tax=Bacteroides fragilis (strain YCH46) TaxID=295405 RepID=Q64MB8_BACFR|nr:hypothetical protein [Bacteroides fragilis]BAD51369.1 conserved hypothetical protein [Bacteroides fragilis YCH46]
MARNFTLRLGEVEDQKLQQIKTLVGETTDTGAIKHIIRNYAELSSRYDSEMKRNKKLSSDYQDIKQKVKLFCSALNDLNKL